jgi:tetratricopeptide (TPR) repeat protein
VAERRFQELRQLSNRIFELDKAIRNLPGSIQARQSLVSASLAYLEGLSSDVQADLDLTREIGEGYWRIGRIQGVPVERNLGDEAKAEVTLKKADELIDSLLASRPNDRIALLRSAAIAHDRMILAQEAHRNANAVALASKSANRMEALLRRGDVQDSERDEAAGMYVNLALVHGNIHSYEDAIAYARRAVEIVRPVPSAQRNRSQGLRVLANALQYEGDLENALQAIREAGKSPTKQSIPATRGA